MGLFHLKLKLKTDTTVAGSEFHRCNPLVTALTCNSKISKYSADCKSETF